MTVHLKSLVPKDGRQVVPEADAHEIDRLRRRELEMLERRGLKVLAGIQTVLRQDGRPPLRVVSKEDRYRLLTLEDWSEKYCVPLDFVLRTLIRFWTQHFQKKSRRQLILGCRVVTLVGKTSEQILVEEIGRSFPEGENVDEHRQRRRMEVAGLLRRGRVRPLSVLGCRTPEEFAALYRQAIRRRQQQWLELETSEKWRRHPYRDNPWR